LPIAIVEALSSGPKDTRELLLLCGRIIAPERAMREFLRRQRRRSDIFTDKHKVESGKTRIIASELSYLRRAGRIVRLSDSNLARRDHCWALAAPGAQPAAEAPKLEGGTAAAC
jgi:hypothetical protein